MREYKNNIKCASFQIEGETKFVSRKNYLTKSYVRISAERDGVLKCRGSNGLGDDTYDTKFYISGNLCSRHFLTLLFCCKKNGYKSFDFRRERWI